MHISTEDPIYARSFCSSPPLSVWSTSLRRFRTFSLLCTTWMISIMWTTLTSNSFLVPWSVLWQRSWQQGNTSPSHWGCKVRVYCFVCYIVCACGCIVHCRLCFLHLLSLSFLFFALVFTSSSPGNPAGKITIQAEEVQDSKFVVDFELSATKLEKKDLFGKVGIEAGLDVFNHQPLCISYPLIHTHNLQSDPYIEIAKSQEGGAFTMVYRSQPIMKTLSPR